jgi:hypothetical protein
MEHGGTERTSGLADLTISREDGFYLFSTIALCVPGLDLRMAYVMQQWSGAAAALRCGQS